MNIEELRRHFRHYSRTVEFISQERHWFKEILGDAYIDYDYHLGQLLKLLLVRMEGICQSLEK